MPIGYIAPDISLGSLPIINFTELQLGKKLGEGAYGVVYMAVMLRTGQRVAVKTLVKKDSDDSRAFEEMQEFKDEATLMTSLKHPNLVCMLGICLPPNLAMVMELINHGIWLTLNVSLTRLQAICTN